MNSHYKTFEGIWTSGCIEIQNLSNLENQHLNIPNFNKNQKISILRMPWFEEIWSESHRSSHLRVGSNPNCPQNQDLWCFNIISFFMIFDKPTRAEFILVFLPRNCKKNKKSNQTQCQSTWAYQLGKGQKTRYPET